MLVWQRPCYTYAGAVWIGHGSEHMFLTGGDVCFCDRLERQRAGSDDQIIGTVHYFAGDGIGCRQIALRIKHPDVALVGRHKSKFLQPVGYPVYVIVEQGCRPDLHDRDGGIALLFGCFLVPFSLLQIRQKQQQGGAQDQCNGQPKVFDKVPHVGKFIV